MRPQILAEDVSFPKKYVFLHNDIFFVKYEVECNCWKRISLDVQKLLQIIKTSVIETCKTKFMEKNICNSLLVSIIEEKSN